MSEELLTTLTWLIPAGPLLVFFLLTAKDEINQWFSRFLPENNGMAHQVWTEVDPDHRFGSHWGGINLLNSD